MQRRKRFIAVAGNIGAGKSELVGFLCRRFHLQPYLEPNETNPYLDDFYRDMKAWAFRSQVYFLSHKFRLHREVMQSPGTVVLDRTIYEDAEIFARNLHDTGCIDDRDWKTYRELYDAVTRVLDPPDLMIFLRCPVRTLRRRIAQRGRPSEREIPLAYLKRLDRLYGEWREHYTLSPVIELPTDKLDYITDLIDRLDLLRQIEKYVGA